MKPNIAEITDQWIKGKSPCSPAVDWWDKTERDPIVLLDKLIAEKHYDWANWFIVRIMEKNDYISYAIFAAEQVIGIYEKKYPHDTRPRNAIEAARNYLNNKTKNAAADAAAYAAYAAAAAAAAAAADAAADAAAAAYAAAADASARKEMQLRILTYGANLLKT